ncbi:MAG: sigma-54-dependent transcriptional regulator [Nitrospiria bacterium]
MLAGKTRHPNQKPILIVDDEPAMRTALKALLKRQGYAVLTASSGEEALNICQNRIKETPIGVILSDMKMPGMSGIELFQQIKKHHLETPAIMMSAFGTISGAVEAMKSGVENYLLKPFSEEALLNVIRKAMLKNEQGSVVQKTNESPSSKQDGMPSDYAGRMIVTSDPGMKKILKMAEIVAASQATILIEAESGTGKELLARFIHEHSPRAHHPFVAINCAAVPESLLESELFGYEKGAFTGAETKKPGRFELAHQGTLLLDEVSEMNLSLQAKLLRVIQEREVDLLGSKAPLPVNIRVIATTNRSLLDEVKAGRFREDLYYRLNVFPLQIPPLRKRTEDIPKLVAHFVQKASGQNEDPSQSIAPDALETLMTMEWRGNVRELENVMERAILLSEGNLITKEHLLFTNSIEVKQERNPQEGMTVWEAERNLILETLSRVSGNRTHAARILGISIRTLRNKLREYHQLDPDCEETGINK